MACFTIRLFGLLLAQSCLPTSAVPKFEVDLDEDPRKRWRHVTEYWKDYAVAMGARARESITAALRDDLPEWFKVADQSFDEESTQEIEGILETLNDTSMPFAEQVRWGKLHNLLYELGSPTVPQPEEPSACAGVLWAMENGTVIHGRNMDYSSPFAMIDKETGETRQLDLDDVTYEVVFKKNGNPLYVATMWPGTFVGVHTGMRYNGWTFEQNTRLGYNTPGPNLRAGKQGGGHFGLVVRRTMERTDSFEEAVQTLYNYSYMAPQYFVMAGKGAYEGAILTINRLGASQMTKKLTPSIVHLSSSPDSAWHLVQTNDDQNKWPLDLRRPIAKLELSMLERSAVSVENMAKYMSYPPLKNPLTRFTTVMAPAMGHYETILRSETQWSSTIFSAAAASLEQSPQPMKTSPHSSSKQPRKRKLRGRFLHAESDEEDESAFMQLSLERPEL